MAQDVWSEFKELGFLNVCCNPGFRGPGVLAGIQARWKIEACSFSMIPFYCLLAVIVRCSRGCPKKVQARHTAQKQGSGFIGAYFHSCMLRSLSHNLAVALIIELAWCSFLSHS